MGLGGFFVASNYDTWIAGQGVNSVGPNQQMAILAAAGVAAVGGGLFAMTLFGLGRHRGEERAEFAAFEAQAPAMEMAQPAVPSRAPVEEVEEAPARPARPPSPAPAAVPVYPPSVSRPPATAAVAPVQPAVEEEEAEEEEEAIELPAAAPALEASPPREVGEVEAAAAPSASAGEKDELEDLFGELESEVATTDEDEVHYECPNCHGIVREDDTSCPHCQVVFEGS